MSKQVAFISYSHKDSDKVSLFASILSKNDYDVWMDTKKLNLGESIITAVSKTLSECDIYIIFLSQNSVNSKWVTEELNIALSHFIQNSKPQIIPILLDDCPLPPSLTGRLYLDAQGSIEQSLLSFQKQFVISSDEQTAENFSINKPILSGIVFGLSEETSVSVSSIDNTFSEKDIIIDRERIQKNLRKKANGVLLNFVTFDDFDIESPVPRFRNGIYDESVERIPGDLVSSYQEKIGISATVFNPEYSRVMDLINNKKLEALSATSIAYIFAVPMKQKDFDKTCLKKLQKTYPILSYSYEDGITIQYDDDLFLDVKITHEQIKVRLSTKYSFSFAKKAVEFDVQRFINWLINT